MRFFLLFAFLFLACSGDDSPPAKYASAAAAVDAFCVDVCSWADKCGAFYPEACGELCSSADCVATCTAEVCARDGNDCAAADAPADDATLDKCLAGVQAQMRDCTEYRPTVPTCETAFGYWAAP